MVFIMEEFITDSYKSSTGDSVTQSYVYKPDNQGMKPRHEETSFEAMKHPGFAKRFREACRDNKLPPRQKEVSKFLQTTTTTAWNYLNGEKLPSMESAIEMAGRFGVCTEWLLSGRGPKRPDSVGEGSDRYLIDISDLPPDSQVTIQEVVRTLKKHQKDPVGNDRE